MVAVKLIVLLCTFVNNCKVNNFMKNKKNITIKNYVEIIFISY